MLSIFVATIRALMLLSIVTTASSVLDSAVAAESTDVGKKPDKDGCAKSGTISGVLIGASVGLLGAALGMKPKAAIMLGTSAAVAGGVIGHELDRRKCRLKAIAKQHKLEMEMIEIAAPVTPEVAGQPAQPKAGSVGVLVAIQDRGTQFAADSDELTPDALNYFGQIADNYSYERALALLPSDATEAMRAETEALAHKVILLVGHTDDMGSSKYNAELSERRARSVAKVFETHGIPASQIYFQGAGETLPVADNRTEKGRAKNRRVEIVDMPDQAALATYIVQRAPALSNYRPIEASNTEVLVAELLPEQPAEPDRTVRPKSKAKSKAKAAAKEKPAAVAVVKQPTPPAPAALPKPTSVQTAKAPITDDIDFGGQLTTRLAPPDIGALIKPVSKMPFGGNAANAATLDKIGLASCTADRPRVAYAVKHLDTNAPLAFSTGEYIRGMYNTSWIDTVNGNLVSLIHVTVLRDNATPAAPPDLLIYRDWTAQPIKTKRPSVRARVQVNVYRGERGLLYRVFASGAANVRCMDIILPRDGGFEALPSKMVYTMNGEQYSQSFKPQVAH